MNGVPILERIRRNGINYFLIIALICPIISGMPLRFIVKLSEEHDLDPNEVASSLNYINEGSIGTSNWYYFVENRPNDLSSPDISIDSLTKELYRSYQEDRYKQAFRDLKEQSEFYGIEIVQPLYNSPIKFHNSPIDYTNVDLDKSISGENYVNCKDRNLRDSDELFNDPLFPLQWHLKNKGGSKGYTAGADINVESVWREGFSGKGVLIQIVDTGIDPQSPEFINRWVAEASFNYKTFTNDTSPDSSTHGIEVGSLAAGEGNNSICGVGVAWGASIAAIKRSGFIPNALYLQDFTLNTGVDISINSWGIDVPSILLPQYPVPQDLLLFEAQQTAVTKGRDGKGLIILTSVGNGGGSNENANYDPVWTSPWIIAVGALTPDGKIASYSEAAAYTMISAPGGGFDLKTADGSIGRGMVMSCEQLGSGSCPSTECTLPQNGQAGTSFANPIVGGAIALLLELRPDLTYRDVMHLLVISAKQDDTILEDSHWQVNGVGHYHHPKYGFGVLDVKALVETAKSWPLVDSQVIQSIADKDENLESMFDLTLYQRTLEVHNEMSLEHVMTNVQIDHDRPNELNITLISPAGTHSVLHTVESGYLNTLHINVRNENQWLSYYLAVFDISWGSISDMNLKVANGLSVATFDEDCNVQAGTNRFELGTWYLQRGPSECGQNGYPLLAIATMFNPRLIICEFVLENNGLVTPLTVNTDPPSELSETFVTLDLFNGGSMRNLVKGFVGNNPQGYTDIEITLSNKPPPDKLNGLLRWQFSTVAHWGESAVGNWTLEIIDVVPGDTGMFIGWSLDLYGTRESAASTIIVTFSSLILSLFVIVLL